MLLSKHSSIIPQLSTLTAINDEIEDVKTFTLELMDTEKSLNFTPGQFNMVSVFGVGEVPLSFSSEPNGINAFTHTVRSVGRVTDKISTLKIGDTVGIRGPFGNGWPKLESMKGKNVLIAAGGLGLAPLRPLIIQLVKNIDLFKSVEIYYGAKSVDQLLFASQYKEWQENGISINLTVDKGTTAKWPFHAGVVTSLFDRIKAQPSDIVSLVCGPEIMMKFSILDLIRREVDLSQIYISLERRMDCAIGTCGHCQLGPVYVCKNGPVFKYSEIKELFGNVA